MPNIQNNTESLQIKEILHQLSNNSLDTFKKSSKYSNLSGISIAVILAWTHSYEALSLLLGITTMGVAATISFTLMASFFLILLAHNIITKKELLNVYYYDKDLNDLLIELNKLTNSSESFMNTFKEMKILSETKCKPLANEYDLLEKDKLTSKTDKNIAFMKFKNCQANLFLNSLIKNIETVLNLYKKYLKINNIKIDSKIPIWELQIKDKELQNKIKTIYTKYNSIVISLFHNDIKFQQYWIKKIYNL